MECKFMPGDRLVCVKAMDAGPGHFWSGTPCPVKVREIYTCRKVFVNARGGLCVKLEEVPRLFNVRVQRWIVYPGFHPRWFEKLVDLRIFYAMCNRAPSGRQKETVE